MKNLLILTSTLFASVLLVSCKPNSEDETNRWIELSRRQGLIQRQELKTQMEVFASEIRDIEMLQRFKENSAYKVGDTIYLVSTHPFK